MLERLQRLEQNIAPLRRLQAGYTVQDVAGDTHWTWALATDCSNLQPSSNSAQQIPNATVGGSHCIMAQESQVVLRPGCPGKAEPAWRLHT
jgi:hypothetical protein